MQRRIAELIRASQRELAVARTPGDAMQTLAQRGSQIGVAIVASQPGWGHELRAVLARHYPAIQRIILVG